MCWSTPSPPSVSLVTPAPPSTMGNDTNNTTVEEVSCSKGYSLCSVEENNCVNGICCILNGDKSCRCFKGYHGTLCQRKISSLGADTTIGIVIGLVLVVIVIVVLVIFLIRKKGCQASCRNKHEVNERASEGQSAVDECPGCMCTKCVSSESTASEGCFKKISKTPGDEGSEKPKEDDSLQSTPMDEFEATTTCPTDILRDK